MLPAEYLESLLVLFSYDWKWYVDRAIESRPELCM